MKLRNPFAVDGRWYRANLHTHTTTSDGRASPADTAAMYRQAGYQVLALTDHRKTNDVSGLSKKDFLVISGMEYHPACKKAENCHHLVAVNVPHGFDFPADVADDAQTCLNLVKDAGGETILCHPHWCGHRFDQYSYLEGYVAMEVYNATCDKIGRSNGEVDWAQLLDAGRIIPAVAVDDTHSEPDRFQAWTWLKLPSLTVRSVLTALRNGCYYSSTGPTIEDFHVRRHTVELTCSPAEFIYLSAQTYHGGRLKAEPGKTIRHLSMEIPKDWQYVRAVVVDRTGRKAWTNPIVL